MAESRTFREVNLTYGERADPQGEGFALKRKTTIKGLEMLNNLSDLGGALTQIIEPGMALAFYVIPDDDDENMVTVRVIGLEPVGGEETEAEMEARCDAEADASERSAWDDV